MVNVLKSNTTLQQQKQTLEIEMNILNSEIETLISLNKGRIKKNAIKGSIIGIFLGFIVFSPFTAILGWLIGWYGTKFSVASVQRRKLSQLVREYQPINKGETGESKVIEILKQGLSENYILLNDIEVPSYNGKTTQIDHVLISPTEIICIETKNISGKFYPSTDGWKWYPYNGNYVKKTTIMKSPQDQSLYHAKKLSEYLKVNNLLVNVLPIVVLTNPKCTWKGERGKGICPVLYLRDLISFLSFRETQPIKQFNELQKKRIIAILNRK